MWQYAISEIRLDVSAGECIGDDETCTFAGVVDAVLDPINEVARWTCPVCSTENETDIPTDAPDHHHDERAAA